MVAPRVQREYLPHFAAPVALNFCSVMLSGIGVLSVSPKSDLPSPVAEMTGRGREITPIQKGAIRVPVTRLDKQKIDRVCCHCYDAICISHLKPLDLPLVISNLFQFDLDCIRHSTTHLAKRAEDLFSLPYSHGINCCACIKY